MEKAVGKLSERLAKRRVDMYLPNGPKDFDIIEITGTSNFTHSHVYMENYVFTPDSQRFVFCRHRNYVPRALDENSMSTEIFICDMDDGYSVRQLTDEKIIGLCNISPDCYIQQRRTMQNAASLCRACLGGYVLN